MFFQVMVSQVRPQESKKAQKNKVCYTQILEIGTAHHAGPYGEAPALAGARKGTSNGRPGLYWSFCEKG